MASTSQTESYVVVTPNGGWKITKTLLQTFVCDGTYEPGLALAVNDNDWVVGWSNVRSYFGGCNRHAFLIRPGQRIRDLTSHALDAEAVDVNNQGTVIGTTDGRAFRWSLTTGLQYLPQVAGVAGVPTAINAGGDIVGTVATATGRHAVLWPAAGGVVDLAPMNSATAIADDGQILGVAPLSPAGNHAVVRYPDGELHDLGTQGAGAEATGFLYGYYVGNYLDSSREPHAVIMKWEGPPWIPIPTLGGLVNQVHDSRDGAAVGWSDTFNPEGGTSSREAFFWSAASGSLRLNFSPSCGGDDNGGWSEARAINRRRATVVGGEIIPCVGFRPVMWKVARLP
jgi:uncharacterized membrane protein